MIRNHVQQDTGRRDHTHLTAAVTKLFCNQNANTDIDVSYPTPEVFLQCLFKAQFAGLYNE